jgi:hypothetical protein
MEAVKKARKEAEETARAEVEAEISKLRADADTRVAELTTLLDQMSQRAKSHEAKLDAEVRVCFLDGVRLLSLHAPFVPVPSVGCRSARCKPENSRDSPIWRR